jgi:hypothetical protein
MAESTVTPAAPPTVEPACPLLREISDQQWQFIAQVVKRLYRHPLWSMSDVMIHEVINLNKPKSTQQLFRKHDLTFEYARTGHA